MQVHVIPFLNKNKIIQGEKKYSLHLKMNDLVRPCAYSRNIF